MRKAIQLTAMLLISALAAPAQQTDTGALQQQLNSQYQLTQLSSERTTVVSTGTVLRITKDGLVMYATSSPLPPSNTYKNGKITQGSGGFFRDTAITMAKGGQGTANDVPHRKFAVNELVWVLKVDAHPTDVTLRLCGAPDDGVLYYADLKVPFDKGANPTADQAIAKIGEVLTLESASPQPQAVAQSAPAASAAGSGAGSVAGLYAVQNTSAQIQLNSDGSFILRTADGRENPGQYSVSGNSLVLTYASTGRSTAPYTIKGNNVYVGDRLAWVRQGAAPVSAVAASGPAPAAAMVEPHYPALYVSTKSPADQIRLNADKSFSLKESGQPYSGKFEIKGDKLELNIKETDTVTEVTLQGKSLTDNSGNTWLLQPAGK